MASCTNQATQPWLIRGIPSCRVELPRGGLAGGVAPHLSSSARSFDSIRFDSNETGGAHHRHAHFLSNSNRRRRPPLLLPTDFSPSAPTEASRPTQQARRGCAMTEPPRVSFRDGRLASRKAEEAGKDLDISRIRSLLRCISPPQVLDPSAVLVLDVPLLARNPHQPPSMPMCQW